MLQVFQNRGSTIVLFLGAGDRCGGRKAREGRGRKKPTAEGQATPDVAPRDGEDRMQEDRMQEDDL